MASQIICKSVFKNGQDIPADNQITQIWIKLINQLEQSKSIIASTQ